MNIASYIFISLFALISLVHLFFCFTEKETLRKITKPFCLLFLGLFALVTLPNAPLIYIGAFLGMIGDIFLIFQKKLPLFLIGTAIFTGGHICYLIQMVSLISYGSAIPFWVYIIIGAALILLTFALYPLDKKIAGPATLAGNFYMPMLVVLIGFGIMLTIDQKAFIGSLLIPIGYALFLISDCTLTYATYIKDFKRRDFPIMLTYLLAEFGIVFGLVLTVLPH